MFGAGFSCRRSPPHGGLRFMSRQPFLFDVLWRRREQSPAAKATMRGESPCPFAAGTRERTRKSCSFPEHFRSRPPTARAVPAYCTRRTARCARPFSCPWARWEASRPLRRMILRPSARRSSSAIPIIGISAPGTRWWRGAAACTASTPGPGPQRGLSGLQSLRLTHDQGGGRHLPFPP